MKKFALFAAAALIASPAAFAADKTLCELNLQEIDDNMTVNQATLGEPARSEIEELVSQAKQAHQAGNTEECIAHSTKAMQKLKGPGSSGASGTAGSGSGAGN